MPNTSTTEPTIIKNRPTVKETCSKCGSDDMTCDIKHGSTARFVGYICNDCGHKMRFED